MPQDNFGTPGDNTRLAVLDSYGILDTPAEQSFDDIVELATLICETPIALVSLVDRDRQWFKARVGFEPRETPLEQSVCAHALAQTGTLVIPDLTADERTKTNTLVTGVPYIRFYAGAPLVARGGQVLGTLCVIDHAPRPEGLTPTQTKALEALARQVVDLLEMRRAVDDRDAALSGQVAAEHRYRQTFQSVTEFAVVVTDRDGIVTEWNTGAERILGWTASEMRGQEVARFFTPEDRAGGRPRIEMDEALRDGQAPDERWHMKADGSRFYSSGNMMPLVGDDGAHRGYVKILRDRTAQRQAETSLGASEQRYRTLYDAIDEGFCIIEVRFDDAGKPVDYRFIETNPAFERQTGLKDVVGRWMRDLAPEHEEHWFEIYGRIARGGVADRFEQPAKALGDRWYEVFAYPTGGPRSGQVAVLFNDVSGRRRAVAALADSERKWRGLFEDLQEGFILGRVVRDETGRITDWRYEEVNRAWGELVGVSSEQAAGRTIREIFPGIEDAWVNEFADVVESGRPISFTRQVGTIGRWYDGVCQPAGDDRFTVIFLEVTDRVRAERRREALAELGHVLSTLADLNEMSATAAAIVGKALGVRRVGYGTLDADGATFAVPSDWTADGYPSLAGIYRTDDYGGYAEDLRRGRTVVIRDIRLDPRTSGNTGPLESVAVRSLINLPIVENGRTVAVLYVNDDQPRDWTASEIDFLADAAGRTRVAIERRRAEDDLRRTQEQFRLAVEATNIGIFDYDLVHDVLRWDERCHALFGLPATAPVTYRTFLAGLHPEDREWVDEAVARCLDPKGGGAYDVEYRTVDLGNGAERWVAAKGQAFFEEGRAVRFIGTVRDVTEQTLARRQRDDEREQLAAIFSQSPSFMALLRGPEHRFERVNPSYVNLIGGRELIGQTVAEALPEAAAQGFVDLLDKVYRSGEPYFASATRFALQMSPNGPVMPRDLDFVYQPIRDADGEINGIFVEGIDVTDRLQAARRLRETEDRYRALVENVDVGMCVIEMKFDAAGRAIDYRMVDGNAAYEHLTGLHGSIGKWVSEFAPNLERHWFDLYGKVATTGETARFENQAESLDGRWFEVQALRVGAAEERQVAILFTDVTERRQRDERRAVLNRELSHRLKNTLAVVQSIATQTLRASPDVATARKTLTERIGALSRAHDILLTGQHDAAPIAAIVKAVISLHDEGQRIQATGPDVRLGPQAALTFSLILHELSTNAAKYGALSVDTGIVDIDWSVAPDKETGRPDLTFVWREIGGPPVMPPAKKSFGTRLIEMGLSGAAESTSRIEYAPGGIVCRLTASLSEMQSTVEPDGV